MFALLPTTAALAAVDFGGMTLNAKIAVVVLLVLSLGAHEAAHAWVALKCGDPTGRDMGRITLNPLPHIDPFMTILLPGVLVMSGSAFLFGGAKPVPVNFYNLRRPYRDMALVAIAGPLSNFLIAFLLFAVSRALPGSWDDKLLPDILLWAAYFNLLLAAFNLLPIPPLDGSRVMTWILPSSLRPAYQSFEQFGILIVFGLFIFAPGLVRGPVNSVINAQAYLIDGTLRLVGLSP